MKTLDYSRITCPVTFELLTLCECQNCVLARMEEDYQEWKRVCAQQRKLKFFLLMVSAGFVALVCLAASR